MTILSEKYGQVAVIATELQHGGECNAPRGAWKKAVEIVFKKDEQDYKVKNCPLDAYLGLCEDGLVKRVPSGKYTNSKDGKRYAVDAVSELRENPNLTENELWERVTTKRKTYNHQMGVVLALWWKGWVV